ncbi:major facilitator superfamily domain-containing protein 6-like [Planoprotostelium fungivorum]|uniref:Major facilitator superfamily domain-containing protein 6-like n=1 Tax=Planoprotostelium fungivorum TaxID=1890364 RepID=A0A2P6NWT1_9EUKA|nr:major facilitator superfamily domain-containing protein 6-like [Planoprotostelium fungivorum]
MGTDGTHTSPWSIDRTLLLPKVLYFVQCGANVCYLPFLGIWLLSIGLKPPEIGQIAALRYLMILFGAPFWAFIADHFYAHKQVLILVIVMSVITRMAMPFIGGSSLILLMCATVSSDFFYSIIAPMLDRTALYILGDDRKDMFGRQRLWGTISWGALSVPVGSFVAYIDDSKWYFYLYAILSCIMVALLIPAPISAAKGGPPFWKGLKFLGRPRAAAFYFCMVMVGCCNGLISNFLFVHLKSLHAEPALMGLTLTVNCLTEIPCLFFSGVILKKVTPQGGILLAAIAFIIRFFDYYLITNPYHCLIVEPLHGISFGIMFASAVRIASELVPSNLSTTAQGLLAGMTGLGGMIGAILGGYIYESFKAKVFLFAMIAPTLIIIVFSPLALMDYLTFRRSTSNYGKLQTGNEEEFEMKREERVDEPVVLNDLQPRHTRMDKLFIACHRIISAHLYLII